MSVSQNLALPFVQAAQAQKHVTVNEAFETIDAVVQLSVRAIGLVAPPDDPAPGDRYVVGAGASGAWAGRDGAIAVFRGSGWTFVTPGRGWTAFDESDDRLHALTATGWRPVDEEGGVESVTAVLSGTTLSVAVDGAAGEVDLAGLGGGEAVDVLGVGGASPDDTNRLAVASPAVLLTHAGDDLRVGLNKAGTADTASLVFQSGWSGRAEFGLAGEDAFSVKVSPDGAAWRVSLRADPASGTLTAPSGFDAAGLVGTLPPAAIGAGSIARDKLATGVPATVTLMAGDHANRVPGATLETLAAWTVRTASTLHLVDAYPAADTPGVLALDATGSGSWDDLAASDPFPVEGGSPHLVSAQHWVEGGGGNRIRLRLELLDGSDQPVGTVDAIDATFADTAPTVRAAVVEVPAGAAKARLVPAIHDPSSSGRALFAAPVVRVAASTGTIADGAVTPDKLAGYASSRAALAGMTIPATVQTAVTGGFAWENDGGGARYRRVAADPGHPAAVATADGAWWEIDEPSVRPEHLGYRPGAAIAANTSAFLSAVDAANALGRPLALGPGDYEIALESAAGRALQGIAIVGAGRTRTRLVARSTLAYFDLFRTGADDCALRGLAIALEAAPGGTAVGLMPRHGGLVLHDVRFEGNSAAADGSYERSVYALSLPESGAVDDLVIDHCVFAGMNRSILVTNTSTVAISNVVVRDCFFHGNFDEDVGFNCPSATARNVRIVGNHFSDNRGTEAGRNGLHVALARVKNVVIANNTFEGPIGDVIHLEEGVSDFSIVGNVAKSDFAPTASSSGVFMIENDVGGSMALVTHGTIVANTFEHVGATRAGIGIRLVKDGIREDFAGHALIVEGNVVRGAQTGYQLSAMSAGGSTVAHNLAEDCTIGFHAVATAEAMLSGNVSRTCDVGVKSTGGAVFSGHRFAGCLATAEREGDGGGCTLLDPRWSAPEETLAAGASAVHDLAVLDAGTRLAGTLATVVSAGRGNQHVTRLAEVSWNGTGFSETVSLDFSPGAIAARAERAGNALRAVVSNADAAATDRVRFGARLSGVLVQ